jgi:hypothetical protein
MVTSWSRLTGAGWAVVVKPILIRPLARIIPSAVAVSSLKTTRRPAAMPVDPAIQILMIFILPLWLAAGFADWACHRATAIETTAGPRESLIHILMFAEVGIPLLAALFLEIDALVIALMIGAFLLHEATALWDVSFAVQRREVTPFEQHVHSFLEMIPLMGMVILIAHHWGQFLALFGTGTESARFSAVLKAEPLPASYLVAVLSGVVLFAIIPYAEELIRCLKASGGRLPA